MTAIYDDEAIDERRMLQARAKLSLLLGAMQGNAMKDRLEHLPSDHVLLTARVNDADLTITWGELALCAGATAFAGGALLTPEELDHRLREVARRIRIEFGFDKDDAA